MASVEKSIITLFLERLNVKHTQYYTDKLFNEHPNKYNLFGLSDILTTYRIENWAFRMEKKEDIYMAKTPFLAHAGGDFVVVDGISEDRVHYVWNGKYISVPVEEFFKIWTGVILLAEPDEQSAEPDYSQHRQQQKIRKLKHFAIAISLSVIFLVICAVAKVYASLGLLLLFLLNMAGVYVGYLLLLKHLHIRNAYGDKICSLFKQTDCNNILESKASSFLGLISWSEIGLGYFISNVIIILFFPHLSTWMVLINICALPYSFWSIWYQGLKVKRWCPLCLMVQALMWIIFFLNLGFGFISLPFFDILQIGTVVCIYLIPILLIHSAAPFVEDKHRLETLTQEMNSLKANENVFKTLLSDQPHYDVSIANSHVLWGSLSAHMLVTVLTNPHCNPCGKMHKRIGMLLKKNEQIRVQYIFSSFSPDLEISARYLIAVYQQKSREECEKIYDEWFEFGKFDKELFFKKYPVDIYNTAVTDEFNKHNQWVISTQLRGTPTLLVNGFKLPENYQVEDLKYFTDLELEI